MKTRSPVEQVILFTEIDEHLSRYCQKDESGQALMRRQATYTRPVFNTPQTSAELGRTFMASAEHDGPKLAALCTSGPILMPITSRMSENKFFQIRFS